MHKLIRNLRRVATAFGFVLTLGTISGAAAAVVPLQGQGYVERPIGTSGLYEQPVYGSGGFFEGHTGSDGRLWILDRQTGRVRSCAPGNDAAKPPRCSPWSE